MLSGSDLGIEHFSKWYMQSYSVWFDVEWCGGQHAEEAGSWDREEKEKKLPRQDPHERNHEVSWFSGINKSINNILYIVYKDESSHCMYVVQAHNIWLFKKHVIVQT